MNTHELYLRIHADYSQALGGLRWSLTDEAIEYADGETFAFNEEIAVFLEGFASRRRLMNFCYVLHAVDMLIGTRRTIRMELVRLREAFGKAGRMRRIAGERTYADGGRCRRNAGALFAVLCRNVPDVPGPVNGGLVRARLREREAPISWYVAAYHDVFQAAPQPPWEPAAFEDEIARAVEAYSTEELVAWFRDGQGPVREAGEAIARQLALPARTLIGVLADLLRWPRLADASPYLAQLVSALALPAARLEQQEIPAGGYADMTTRGIPDRIVPSQFALDEWDFFRRYAENELLFFRREEPHTRVRRELVVLLDQGVRTWGPVRLVLAAALVALGKQADRPDIHFLVGTTAREGELLDPLQPGAVALEEVVEASDLSLNPGLALERVLEEPPTAPRDVVLLTHTRNLREPDVRAAARRRTADGRLFSVALDETGMVDFCELKHGVPVSFRQFRVEFKEPTPPTPTECPRPVANEAPWQGDIEPVGFPFLFGATGRLDLADFDDAGEWLLTAASEGVLYAWKVDGSRREILPRGLQGGAVLTNLHDLVGVAGGFVVVGGIDERLVSVYYDFGKRKVAAQLLGLAGQGQATLAYCPKRHVVLIAPETGEYYELNLHDESSSSFGRDRPPRSTSRPPPSLRSEMTRLRGLLEALPHPLIGEGVCEPFICLYPGSGTLLVQGGGRDSRRLFTPLADGRPVLAGHALVAARHRGGILAAVVVNESATHQGTLHLFRYPEGVPLAEYAAWPASRGFALSRDGRFLARQPSHNQWEVLDLTLEMNPVLRTIRGGYSQHAELALGNGWLGLGTGRGHSHWIHWERGVLEIEHGREDGFDSERKRRDVPGASPQVADRPEWLTEAVLYYRRRFRTSIEADLSAALDRFGQVAVFDRQRQLICMFFGFRGAIAAWMPDGTYYGPPALTGRQATANAREKIGQALKAASETWWVRP